MQVAAGWLKGMPLAAPRHLRATESKVRQAMFNILGGRVEGACVIDAFAGSGALGIEALSHGAQQVIFLEHHPACVAALQRNLAKIRPGQVPGSWQLVRGDALRHLTRLAEQGLRADVLLADPPYRGGWGKKLLREASACAILAPTGILCLEHARHDEPEEAVGSLVVRTRHRYGETVLSFYQHA